MTITESGPELQSDTGAHTSGVSEHELIVGSVLQRDMSAAQPRFNHRSRVKPAPPPTEVIYSD